MERTELHGGFFTHNPNLGVAVGRESAFHHSKTIKYFFSKTYLKSIYKVQQISLFLLFSITMFFRKIITVLMCDLKEQNLLMIEMILNYFFVNELADKLSSYLLSKLMRVYIKI